MGADIITIIGAEVAGHPHRDNIGTIVIANRASKILNIPVLSAGGICDAAGLISALAMGCCGIVMGTRFVASKECPIHINFKNWIVNANETNTTTCLETVNNVIRVANNTAAQKCQEMERNGAGIEELFSIISGKINKTNYVSGDFENTLFPTGQSVGLITEILSCKEIIDKIITEAEEKIKTLNNIVI